MAHAAAILPKRRHRRHGALVVGLATCCCLGFATMGLSLFRVLALQPSRSFVVTAASSSAVAPLGGRQPVSLRLAASSAAAHGSRHERAALQRMAIGGLDPKALEQLVKDPAQMRQLQAELEQVMADPEKRKAVEQWQAQLQGGIERLKSDPEMKDFFQDIEKNGMAAMAKYEKDERISRKLSEAMVGPEAVGTMKGMAGAPGVRSPVGAPPSFEAGDTVFIHGLQGRPELNGEKAVVVPPTSEERESLKGTGRLTVRLLETGEQFAVKPDNLRTTLQEASDALEGSVLEAEAAKLRESGKLEELRNDPELKPIFEDIEKNGLAALEKHWGNEELMSKIAKALG